MNQVGQIQKDISDQVSVKTEKLLKSGLVLPKNYNYQSALKSAFFALNKVQDRNKQPALQVCTRESIANALLDMVNQGLNPAKTQCYFIIYGNEVQLQRSYFGTITVLKSLEEVKDIYADVIHQDDKFEIAAEEGRMLIKDFEPKFQNLDKPLVGAFAVVEKADGQKVYTIMTKNKLITVGAKLKRIKFRISSPKKWLKELC
jgi:Recombinational DNA repair protein (RecE pathway)